MRGGGNTIRELQPAGSLERRGRGSGQCESGEIAGARDGLLVRARFPHALSLVERCPTGNVAPTADRETNSENVRRGEVLQVHLPQQRWRHHRRQHRVQRRPECSLQTGGTSWDPSAVLVKCLRTYHSVSCIFQDKIRLLHDDLESERELRQRVSERETWSEQRARPRP